jgi:hypothetical protein
MSRMSRRPKSRIESLTFALYSVLVILFCCPGTQLFAERSRQVEVQAKSDEQLKEELQQTANVFLALLKEGNPKDLTLYISRRGVVFSVDEPPTSATEIADEIDKKTGIFCGLFNTECLRREDAIERKRAGVRPSPEPIYSYREQLVTGSIQGVRVGVSNHPRTGLVTVTFKREGRWFGAMEFNFLLERGEWKLSDVPGY